MMFMDFKTDKICVAVIITLMLLCVNVSGKVWKSVDFSELEEFELIQDIDYLAQYLPEKHKNLFFQIEEGYFMNEVESLKENIPGLTVNEIAVGLMRLVALAGDGHTAIYPGAFQFSIFPFYAYWYPDGVYIIAAGESCKEAINGKLIAINGVDVDLVIERLADVISHDNVWGFRASLSGYINIPEVLDGLGMIDDPNSAVLTVCKDGNLIEVEVESVREFSEWLQIRTGTSPFGKHKGENYWYEYLEDSKTVYLRYDRCANMAGETFLKFSKRVFDFIDNHEVDKILVDLRYNGGGNSLIMAPFIAGILLRPQLNRADRLFVAIGRGTFSSAILNAISFSRFTGATFIGEPTGGRPNHYGDPYHFTLPNSHIEVNYSTKYFRRIRTESVALEPKILVISEFVDYYNSVDPVLEKVINY